MHLVGARAATAKADRYECYYKLLVVRSLYILGVVNVLSDLVEVEFTLV